MDYVIAIIGLLGIIGVPVGIGWLIYSFIKHKRKSYPIIAILASIIVFVICGNALPSFENDNQATAETTAESADNELSESEQAEVNSFEIEQEESWTDEQLEDDVDYDNVNPADYDTDITYDDIARNPDDHEGEKVTLSGTIIQVLEDEDYSQYRLAVDDDYDNVVLIEVPSEIMDGRILEDDVLTIYGESEGTVDYESTMGGNITVPFVSVDKFETNGQAE